jgi:hypothetical protein
MPKGKYFGATDSELEKLRDELIAWRQQEFSDRRAYFLQHGKYRKSPRHRYLEQFTVVKVLAEAHIAYFKNYRLIYRQPYQDPNAGVGQHLESAVPGSMDALARQMEEIQHSLAPHVCTGLILGIKRRQEGKRFPGHGPGFESDAEPASFEHYRTSTVYLVAVDLFTNPIEVPVDDVVVVSKDCAAVRDATDHLYLLMDGGKASGAAGLAD